MARGPKIFIGTLSGRVTSLQSEVFHLASMESVPEHNKHELNNAKTYIRSLELLD